MHQIGPGRFKNTLFVCKLHYLDHDHENNQHQNYTKFLDSRILLFVMCCSSDKKNWISRPPLGRQEQAINIADFPIRSQGSMTRCGAAGQRYAALVLYSQQHKTSNPSRDRGSKNPFLPSLSLFTDSFPETQLTFLQI